MTFLSMLFSGHISEGSSILGFLSFQREGICILFNKSVIYQIRWYGIAYLLSYFIVKQRVSMTLKRFKVDMSRSEISDLSQFVFLSGIIGGRFWYLVLRYIEYKIPIWRHAFCIWEGGMAIQGGIFFAIVSGILCVYYMNKQKYYGQIADIILANVPIGLCLGRIGNFMNQEFMSTVPYLNIPSCLFASITEGLIPFIILNYILNKKPYKKYLTSIIFMLTYGVMRFINDIFREEETYRILNIELNISQYICIIVIVISLGTLYRIYYNIKNLRS